MPNTTSTFDRQLGELASSLGDATRRGIYLAVREAPEPLTTSHIAGAFGVHPNVARHHLDKLVDDGYLEVEQQRSSGKSGPGAGRPAKHYSPTTKEVRVQLPARRYDLLAELLVRIVERLGGDQAPDIAEEIGREYGRELAAEIGLPEDEGFESAAQAVARVMIGVGFDMEADLEQRTLVTRSCPFGQTALNHPAVICRLDQGIVKGLMEAVQQPSTPVVLPHQQLGEACNTEV